MVLVIAYSCLVSWTNGSLLAFSPLCFSFEEVKFTLCFTSTSKRKHKIRNSYNSIQGMSRQFMMWKVFHFCGSNRSPKTEEQYSDVDFHHHLTAYDDEKFWFHMARFILASLRRGQPYELDNKRLGFSMPLSVYLSRYSCSSLLSPLSLPFSLSCILHMPLSLSVSSPLSVKYRQQAIISSLYI